MIMAAHIHYSMPAGQHWQCICCRCMLCWSLLCSRSHVCLVAGGWGIAWDGPFNKELQVPITLSPTSPILQMLLHYALSHLDTALTGISRLSCHANQALLETAYAGNKLIAAIGHGSAALVNARNRKLGDPSEGRPILYDRQARKCMHAALAHGQGQQACCRCHGLRHSTVLELSAASLVHCLLARALLQAWHDALPNAWRVTRAPHPAAGDRIQQS